MKVVLRNPTTPDGRQNWSITVGHVYEVLGIEADMYRLLNENGEPVLFDPECFEIIDSSEPTFWISVRGEEGERYAYPSEWGEPGFFEDWHDNLNDIRRVFDEQLARWYPETASKRLLS